MNDEEMGEAIKRILRANTTHFEFYDPAVFGLEKLLDEVIAKARTAKRKVFLQTDRELVMFEAYDKIVASEKLPIDPIEELACLLHIQYLVNLYGRGSDEK